MDTAPAPVAPAGPTPRHICIGQALPPGQHPTSPCYLHRVQVLALEGDVRLVVHGDDQWAGVQELGAAVLLERRRPVKGCPATARQPSSRTVLTAPHHVGADNAILRVGGSLPTLVVSQVPLAGPAVACTGDAPAGQGGEERGAYSGCWAVGTVDQQDTHGRFCARLMASRQS